MIRSNPSPFMSSIDWKSILLEEELDPFPPHLKVIELIFSSGKQHEMDFIEYFLLNAELEKLILHNSKEMTVEEELRISEQLMKMKKKAAMFDESSK
ncbi:hypothetical protein AKJ16_DCAP11606 [Drosera capensis]